MKNKGIIEVVTFCINEGFNLDDIGTGLQILESFYKDSEGFHEMDITMVGSNTCKLMLKWDSKEAEKNASGKMMISDTTNDFKKLVNPKTFSKEILSRYTIN